jgi:hypothetical protein
MKYSDSGQYLLSPTPSNEDDKATGRSGLARVMTSLAGKKNQFQLLMESKDPSLRTFQAFIQREHRHDPQASAALLSTLVADAMDVDDEALSRRATRPQSLHSQPASRLASRMLVRELFAAGGDADDFSPLLSLPLEILHRIIELVYYDGNTSSISSNLETFSKTMPLLSKTIHALLLRFLYKYAIFNRPHAFDKFLQNLITNPDIGLYIEFMDFLQFTSIGLGRTGRMNQEIQMVTAETIHTALCLTPNLIEFLALENIQDDMDVGVLDVLFNGLPHLQAMDFCGASSGNFARAFHELVVTVPQLPHLFKLLFHDCSNLTPDTYSKVLPHCPHLRRLDLNHTSVTSLLLNEYMLPQARLTHLLLARCSKLTTRDLIQFLTRHPLVAQGLLRWLSLQTDSNVVSPLSDTYLLYTLRNLDAPRLSYLNLGGLLVDARHLELIRTKFPQLESLAILHAFAVEQHDINNFLRDNIAIKYLDLTGCKKLDRGHIINILKTNFYSAENLVAVEADYKMLSELTSGGGHIKISPQQQLFTDPVVPPQVWKFYDNEGRRLWIYKVDPLDQYYKSVINSSANGNRLVGSILNLTYYDLETGKKIVQKFSKPDFLKYVSRKICCLIGYHRLDDAKKHSYLEGLMDEDVWPAEFSQRGIYNYYLLNVK